MKKGRHAHPKTLFSLWLMCQRNADGTCGWTSDYFATRAMLNRVTVQEWRGGGAIEPFYSRTLRALWPGILLPLKGRPRVYDTLEELLAAAARHGLAVPAPVLALLTAEREPSPHPEAELPPAPGAR